MHKWSTVQQQAIDQRSPHLLVSAGAGSGKTSVLVERVLTRILNDQLELDELLVVTFTEAAAAEMKGRIEEALYAAIKSPAGKRAASQLQLVDRAQISTLHSFCLSILRLGALELPVSPGFRVADGNEAAMLFEQVLTDWLDAWLDNANAARLTFVLRHGDIRGDQGFRKWLKQLYHYVRSQPAPNVFLQEMVSLYVENAQKPLHDMIYADLYAMRLSRQVNKAYDALRQAQNLCDMAGGPNNYMANLDVEIAATDHLRQLLMHKEFTKLADAQVMFTKLPANKEADEDIKKQVQKLRNDAKKTLAELYLRERTPAVLEQEVRESMDDVITLAAMIEDFSQAYAAKKQSLGIVDFQDLEHLAYDLLGHATMQSTIAEELNGRYKDIMVDEYQDTSPLQDAILQALTQFGGPSVFLVGDVKQSIYRFRMAEPGLFLEKIVDYRQDDHVIDMNENYRSRTEVVEAINLLFAQVFTPALGGLIYDQKAQMHALATYPKVPDVTTLASPVELHLVESGSLLTEDEADDEVDDDEDADDTQWLLEMHKTEREGLVIAARISAMMEENHAVYDAHDQQYRPLAYRDVAILLRADRTRINTLLGVLRKAGIPCAGNADSGFFSGYEIRLAHALLHIIDNPQQDIELISVLRSFIGEFTSQDLAQVRQWSEALFYDALRAFTSSEPTAELRVTWDKANRFLARLARWRTVARTTTLPETVSYVLRDSGLLAYFRVARGGLIRTANLSFLERMATVFDGIESHHVSSFIRYLDEHLENSELDLGGAAIFSENDNVVRLMTIHKSKGLEFPVVFVAGLGNKFNIRHDSPFYLHRKYGFGMKKTDLEQRERVPTVTSMALQELDEMESLAEEARVLYVAMTRARERLILVASARDASIWWQQWEARMQVSRGDYGGLSETILLQAKNFIDWIAPAILRAEKGKQHFAMTCWDKVTDFAEPAVEEHGNFDTVQRLLRFDPTILLAATPAEQLQLDALSPVILAAAEAGEVSSQSQVNAKISVTQWRHQMTASLVDLAHDDDTEIAEQMLFPTIATADWVELRPQFLLASQAPTPVEQGTLFHRFMQQIDVLSGSQTQAWFHAQWLRLLQEGVFTETEAQVVDWRWGYQFYRHQLGLRAWQQRDSLKREIPFTMAVPARTLDVAADAHDSVVVQGVVDALFEENGELVIVDYKTDQIRPDEDLQELASKYAISLQLYADAMAKGYDKPVREAWLYYARNDLAVRVIG